MKLNVTRRIESETACETDFREGEVGESSSLAH